MTRDLETEIDGLWTKVRERECETQDLREFYENTLEELAITCSELERLKDTSQENTQRMKEHISELTNELLMARRKSHALHYDHDYATDRTRTPSFSIYGKNAVGMIDSIIKSLKNAPSHSNRGLTLN